VSRSAAGRGPLGCGARRAPGAAGVRGRSGAEAAGVRGAPGAGGRWGAGGPPRIFRTALLVLFHAASCRFRYSSWASCGVL
jgi:hypothetical protein